MTDEFNLSDSEIVVMRILWTLGDISSEEIIAAIPDFYQWSPSTVRTFLARLTKKGITSSTRKGHKFIYHAQKTEDEVIQLLTSELLHKICAMKQTDVVVNLIDYGEFTADDKSRINRHLSAKTEVDKVSCDCLSKFHICNC